MIRARYIPLPTAAWSAQPQGAQWWRRRAIRATGSIVFALCVFSLLRNTFIFSGISDDTDAEHFEPTIEVAYIPFRPAERPPRTKALKPCTELPSSCLDAHVAEGQLCFNEAEPRLDLLWTWVNGSDILLQDALTRVENSLPDDSPYRPTISNHKARQYRDHDELRYSFRSVLKSFRQSAGTFHLLTSDFAIDPEEESDIITSTPDWRLGQTPQWLDGELQEWRDDNVKLVTIHHADIFDPYNDTNFNSLAIESQLGHLESVSENFIYMNDDLFFLHELAQQSFYTSPYGMVLRVQSDLMVLPKPYKPGSLSGEWRGLGVSNLLLSNRFGSRPRPYVSHEAKSSSISLLHEISQIWPEELATAATHPFRETKSGAADLNTMFLQVHFVVERWREALLWTWIVGKHGGLDDQWGEEETANAWRELGGEAGRKEMLAVRADRRRTLEVERVKENLKKAGLAGKDLTTYVFSSQDGFPYTGFQAGKNKWPKFGSEVQDHQLLQCSINATVCFADQDGEPFTRASDVFANIAFRKFECGDCMITALVKASGQLGLSAFLPPPTRSLSSLAGKVVPVDTIPHLPLVNKWEDGQFALRDVVGFSQNTNVRDWTLRLLQRYRFVIGETPSQFTMLKSIGDLTILRSKLKKQPDITLLCINDDITRDYAKVDKLLRDWFKDMWPTPAAWEKY
ncbi:hypothetical protein BC835DRAFT_478460 [Cytidiella melzeri]|nr:hypothetical protein BC835DRAFT_478460 [Cytidiella melzeri]